MAGNARQVGSQGVEEADQLVDMFAVDAATEAGIEDALRSKLDAETAANAAVQAALQYGNWRIWFL